MAGMVTFHAWARAVGWGGVLVVVLVASFAIGGASCGGGGIRCVADSVCQPACAADPDCGPSGSGGTAAGSAGSPGTAGATAGAGGASGVSGNAGSGGAAGNAGASGQTCGPPAVAGQVSFTGVSDVAFSVVTPNVQHKRDIDQFEDGCFNQLDFTFGYAAGCALHIVASDCLDAQGRMKVQSITFTADSQCPNFPDATEGTYTAAAAAIDGSWIAMSMPRITERNVAMSCTGGQFTLTLAGTLTASGSRKLTLGPTSTLMVTGMVLSTAREAACPGQCATGTGGSGGASAGAGGTGGASGGSGSGGASGRGGAGGTGGTSSGGRGGTSSGGRGGTSGSSGGAGAGGTGAAGGAGGTGGPCTGLCSNPIVVQPNMNGGDLGTAATCHAVAGSSGALVCGNFASPRTFTVNSTTVDCSSGLFTLPAPRNGGWCMQASAGNYSYAYFATLNVQ